MQTWGDVLNVYSWKGFVVFCNVFNDNQLLLIKFKIYFQIKCNKLTDSEVVAEFDSLTVTINTFQILFWLYCLYL